MPPLTAPDDTALGLTQEDLKAIDSVRARLFQLANSIGRLKGDVLMSNPMPTPESIQASAFVLQQNLASLNEIMAQHAELFRRIVVHPDPMFPGRSEEQVLTSLLRKKLEPDVEQVAELARDTAAAHGIGPASFLGVDGRRSTQNDDDDDDDEEEDDEDDDDDDDDDDSDDDNNGGPREPLGLGDIWADARAWCIDRIGQFIREEASDLYTKKEREMGVENVRTGLRRSLEEEDDEEDDEDDDEEDDDDVVMLDSNGASMGTAGGAGAKTGAAAGTPVQPPAVPAAEPELLLWMAARGDTNLPRYVEIESQRQAAAAATSSQRR